MARKLPYGIDQRALIPCRLLIGKLRHILGQYQAAPESWHQHHRLVQALGAVHLEDQQILVRDKKACQRHHGFGLLDLRLRFCRSASPSPLGACSGVLVLR